MGSDPQYAKWPLLPLSQHVFALTNHYAARPAQQAAVKSLQDAISEHKMAPLYKYLAHPTEGILNAVGETTSAAGATAAQQKTQSRTLNAAAGMMASKGHTSGANLPWDEQVYQQLKADNDKELDEIQKEEDEAVEKAGDTEIMAARGKRAEFFAKIGDKVRLVH
jgi:26S proteasome regulatory subunit N7